VRYVPEKSFISFFTAKVERRDRCIAQSKNVWHANGNWEDISKIEGDKNGIQLVAGPALDSISYGGTKQQ